MSQQRPPDRALIYHFTHLDNLPSILTCAQMLCDVQMQKKSSFTEVGDLKIKDRRRRRRIPVGPGGTVADYVPFYLAPALEGHQIIGYGDRSARVSDLLPIRLTEGSEVEASSFLTDDTSAINRLDRLSDLVEGYETPYGMELLSTVHFVAHEPPPSSSAVTLNERVARWSSRKARLFTSFHVQAAATRLAEFDLLPDRGQ